MTPADQRHLLCLYRAIYAGLGMNAPSFTNDALVVRAHELSRGFGERALALRSGQAEGAADPAVASMIGHAALEDPSGALALFVVTMLLSPRLLIWLHDLAVLDDDDEVRAGQAFLVSSMNETGAVLATQPPLEGASLEGVVQSYLELLEGLGWSEHLGPR